MCVYVCVQGGFVSLPIMFSQTLHAWSITPFLAFIIMAWLESTVSLSWTEKKRVFDDHSNKINNNSC